MRKANFVVATLVGMAIALGPRPLHAQNARVDQVQKNVRLVALGEVPVRDAAPGGGALYAKGQQIGRLRSNEVITVSEVRTVHTLLGDQKWVRFYRSEKVAPSDGWVLVGTTGTTSNVFAETR